MPSSESHQQRQLRSRPEMVNITYDLQLNGASQIKELPFVGAVLADLSGQPRAPLPPLKSRNFVEIDRDNFDSVLAGMRPALSLEIKGLREDPQATVRVDLNFTSMADFEPLQVARQVEDFRDALALRGWLTDLKRKLDGNDGLDELLRQLAKDTEFRTQLCLEVADQTA